MDTSYKAQSGEDQYQFLAEQLAAGIKVPVARLVHGPTGSPVPVSSTTPMPVHDPLGATQSGQDAVVVAVEQVAQALIPLATAAGLAAAKAVLDQILEKLSTDPATATAQAAELVKLASLDAKIPGLSGGRMPAETDDRVLASLIDESTPGVTYICEALAGTATSAAAWRCQKVTVAGGVTRIFWAAGGAMTQIADNRSSLTYA